MTPKRILIADDSPSACRVLSDLVNSDNELTVAGVAHDGQEAIRMTSDLKPDVIIMDIVMPVMDGLEATKQIMAYSPTPIVIVASSIVKDGRNYAFEALSYGALGVIDKKGVDTSGTPTIETTDLPALLKQLANVKVTPHPLAKIERL